MKFIVVTKTPPKKAMVGVAPAKINVTEVEGDSFEAVVGELDVPLYGECLVIEAEHVKTIRSKVITEVVS